MSEKKETKAEYYTWMGQYLDAAFSGDPEKFAWLASYMMDACDRLPRGYTEHPKSGGLS